MSSIDMALAPETVYGGREELIPVLRKFTDPEKPHLAGLQLVFCMRGDLTETTARRMRAALGEERYQHLHHDTMASDGQVLLWLPRLRHPEASEERTHRTPAEYWWCLRMVEEGAEEVGPMALAEINRIPGDVRRRLLEELPGVEFLRVAEVPYWSHASGKPPRRKVQPPPAGVAFFRFTGGAGLCIAPITKTRRK